MKVSVVGEGWGTDRIAFLTITVFNLINRRFVHD